MIAVDKEKQTSYSVLSVDDDEEMIGLLHEVVSQLGHASVTAVDGVDALDDSGGWQGDEEDEGDAAPR